MTASISHTRDRPIRKGHAALLVIDVQNATLRPEHAKSRPEFHRAATTRVVPNIARLLAAFRASGLEVIYTVMENLTRTDATEVSTTNYPACRSPRVRERRK